MTTYTLPQLLADETTLRRAAGEWLGPVRPDCNNCGVWRKCTDTPVADFGCWSPQEDMKPLPMIADELLHKLLPRERYLIFEVIPQVHEFAEVPGFCSIGEMEYKYAMWFFWASPSEQAACVILALQKGRGSK